MLVVTGPDNNPQEAQCDSSGNLAITQMSILRQLVDSSTTLLAGNASYVGVTVDCLKVRRITGYLRSDVVGNLYIQQSNDGITWETISSVASPGGATAVGFDQVIYARYARLNYTNGATVQTLFRIYGYTCVV